MDSLLRTVPQGIKQSGWQDTDSTAHMALQVALKDSYYYSDMVTNVFGGSMLDVGGPKVSRPGQKHK